MKSANSNLFPNYFDPQTSDLFCLVPAHSVCGFARTNCRLRKVPTLALRERCRADQPDAGQVFRPLSRWPAALQLASSPAASSVHTHPCPTHCFVLFFVRQKTSQKTLVHPLRDLYKLSYSEWAPGVPFQPCRLRTTRRCGTFGGRRAAYFGRAASQPASYGVVFSSGSSSITSASRGWRSLHLWSCNHTSTSPQVKLVNSSRPRRFSLAIRTDRRLFAAGCVWLHACRSLLRAVWQAVGEASRLLRVAVRVHCRHREPPRLAARAVPPSRAGNARMGFLQGLKLLSRVLPSLGYWLSM